MNSVVCCHSDGKDLLKIMSFNTSRSPESICGLEVTQEQLDKYDQEDKELFEAEIAKTAETISPVKKKRKNRNRFAIDSPEKVLKEARIKQKVDDCKKQTPPTRNSKSRSKYRKSY